MTAFALVHSPLVGPATWSAVADELRTRGHDVVVPSLLDAARTGDHRAVVATAADAAKRAQVVVGHSGAGLLLPLIAVAMARAPRALVFVDAAVPPESGTTPLLPDDLLDALRPRAVDGVLPPWSQWFGAGVMEALLPDPATRRAVVAELPRLPLRYFDDAVAPAAVDVGIATGYVLLSPAYEADATEARRRGWHVRSIASTHLGIVTDAVAVTDAILDLPRSRAA